VSKLSPSESYFPFVPLDRMSSILRLLIRHLLGDRATIAKQQKEQKIMNTKSNLVFGFDTGTARRPLQPGRPAWV
jgi:hypothetical protein